MSVRALAGILIATSVSCTLLTNTGGLTGGAGPEDATPDADTTAAADTGTIADATVEAIAASCRGIQETVPEARTGVYALLGRDGGFYCDMTSFDGGWTLVRPDMVREGKTQDVDPTSSNPVDVFAKSDAHGGASWSVTVLGDNCNATPGAPALHWVMVDEVDNWRQIMATYAFREGGDCWSIFRSIDVKGVPNVNIYDFDSALDVLDRQQNMARTTNGESIPYDGRLGYCGAGRENFWSGDYKAQPRTARVVLRRHLQGQPAGLVVSTSCGRPVWELSEVFVR